MSDFELPAIGAPSNTPDAIYINEVPIRFRVNSEYILPSLYESLKEIDSDRQEAYIDLKSALDMLHNNYYSPYDKGENELPVPFTPTENWAGIQKLETSRLRYEAFNKEYWAYARYIDYITSEDRELEIKPKSTTFFMKVDEVLERFEIDDEEGEDVFGAAEKRQRELLGDI